MYSRWPQIELVGAHADPQLAMAEAQHLQPDIVVLDFRRAGQARPEQISAWRRISGASLLVVKPVSQVSSLGELFQSGADGLLAQESEPHEAMLAIDLLAAGYSYLSPDLRTPPFYISRLDEMSLDLVRLMALGWTSQEMAKHLSLDLKVVERRRSELNLELGNPCPTNLTSLAIREGLLPKAMAFTCAQAKHAADVGPTP